MKVWIISLIMGAWMNPQPSAPDSISLAYCYERVREHYPLASKIELQREITDLRVRLAHTGYYPRLDLSGTASYQSEVTRLPSGPGGINVPALSKDQYRVSIDINQPIYSAGRVGYRKGLEQVQGRQERLSSEVQLQELRGQVDEVYFGILLAYQREKTILLLIDNLTTQLRTVKAGVENGILLPSQQYVLQAELAKARQDSTEIQAGIRSGYRVLGELIGQDIPAGTSLVIPEVSYGELAEARPERPELSLFKSSKSALEYRKSLVNSERLPSVSAFATLAYGRPGYNFFNNDFHEFYMVGARLQWNFWSWKNSEDEKKILTISQRQIDEDRLGFNRQLEAALSRIEEQISTLREQMRRDEVIIELRDRVVKESVSQLENGVITASQYVRELNRSGEAQLALLARKIQLARLKIQYATTKGVSLSNVNEPVSTKNKEK